MLVLLVMLVAVIAWAQGHPVITSGGVEQAAKEAKEVRVIEVIGGGLLGGIGACLSALASFASAARPDQRIPEALSNVSITLTRPLIGVASGIAAVLAMKAGVVKSDVSGSAIGIIPLAFGFSERLVIGTFSRLH
jgi:hypothetical protein